MREVVHVAGEVGVVVAGEVVHVAGEGAEVAEVGLAEVRVAVAGEVAMEALQQATIGSTSVNSNDQVGMFGGTRTCLVGLMGRSESTLVSSSEQRIDT